MDMEMLNEAENRKMSLFEADPQPLVEKLSSEVEASNLPKLEGSELEENKKNILPTADEKVVKDDDVNKAKSEELLNGEELETAEVMMSHTVKRMTVEELESQLSPLGKLFIKVVNIRMVFRCEYCEKYVY